MEAINIQFAPATGTADEWNEAYARLADYFRSFRIHNRIRRTQLILETLNKAAKAHELDPTRKPTALAIEKAREAMQEWLSGIYDNLEMTPEQIEVTGRVGFHLSAGPERWSESFLDKRKIPKAMAQAMRAAVTASGPRLDVSKMTPRDIDLGLAEVAEGTFEGLGKYAFIRYLLLALLVIGVLSYVYQLLR
ncbi:MAG: hypothetical protein JNJ83_17590 [Verrucomicrobiaceae bacterium]|nr:hypothetical protein [Verrucomicrobiaceae bacterium]